MDNIVVVYQSKYGSTKKYAQWIAEELSCELFDRKNITVTDLKQYNTVIYGGGLYGGIVSGIGLITKSFDKLSNKNVILFTCGLADPEDKSNTDRTKKSLNKVLSPKMQQIIKVFHLRGGIDYSKLGIVHKAMMAMVHSMIAKKNYNTLNDGEKQILDTYGKVVDFTGKATIMPIVKYVSEL